MIDVRSTHSRKRRSQAIISWKSARSVLVTAVVLVTVCGGTTNTYANRVPSSFAQVGRKYYYISITFNGNGFQTPVLYAAEQSWKVDGIDSRVEFYNTQNGANPVWVRAISSVDIAGAAGRVSNVGCPGTAQQSCNIDFNREYNWNYGTGQPGASQLDFQSVAVHEFGHAVGSRHAGAVLQSDTAEGWFTNYPVLGPAALNGVSNRRVHTDDMQAAKIARPDTADYKNIIANFSFERSIPYGTHPTSGTSNITGWAQRDLGIPGANHFPYPGGIDGSTYMSFTSATGTGTSVYQDINFEAVSPDGAPQSYVYGKRLHIGAWIRGRAAVLRLWHLNSGFYIERLVPSSSTWEPRIMFDPLTSAITNRQFRIEVYDNGPSSPSGYVDLDSMSVTFT